MNVLIKVDRIGVYNIENAFHGLRNPLESWDKSDSEYKMGLDYTNHYIIGEEDMKLALKLIKAGSDHRKFLRQIFVSMDITAPMTWWWDMDTYKVSTVKNSTSRMHKLGNRLLTEKDFSWNEPTYNSKLYKTVDELKIINILMNNVKNHRKETLRYLNELILLWQETKDKNIWQIIIDDLLESYIFLATWTGNYEILRNIYHARKNHKQYEFRDFCKIIETLPYSELITYKGD